MDGWLDGRVGGWMDGWQVPGISMKSSRLGCSGIRPGWIISALLVYTEEGRAEGWTGRLFTGPTEPQTTFINN